MPRIPRITGFADWPLQVPGEALQATLERNRKLQQYYRLYRCAIIPIKFPLSGTKMVPWAPDQEIGQLSNCTVPFGECRIIFASAETSQQCLRDVLSGFESAAVMCDNPFDSFLRTLDNVQLIASSQESGNLIDHSLDKIKSSVIKLKDASTWFVEGCDNLIVYNCQVISPAWMPVIVAILLKAPSVTVIATPENAKLVMLARALAYLLCHTSVNAVHGSTALNVLETFFGNFEELQRSTGMVADTSRLHYRLPSTGAMLLNSINAQLLLTICSYVPKEAGFTPLRIRTMPMKRVTAKGVLLDTDRHFFATQITLPSILAANRFCFFREEDLQILGPLAPSRFLAFTAAAGEALKKLHQAGVIDDNWIPIAQVIDQPMRMEPGLMEGEGRNVSAFYDNETEGEIGPEPQGVVQIKEIVPDELQFTEAWRSVGVALTEVEASFEFHMILFNYWTEPQDADDPDHQTNLACMRLPCDSLIHFTDLNFFAPPASKRSLAILLPQRLEVDLQDVLINLGAYLNIRGRFSAAIPIVLNKTQMVRLVEFQVFLFGALNPRPMNNPDDEEELLEHLPVPDDKKATFLAAIVREADAPPLNWTSDLELTRTLYETFVQNAVQAVGSTMFRPQLPAATFSPKSWQIDWDIVDVVLDQDSYPYLSTLTDKLEGCISDPLFSSLPEAPQFVTSPEKAPTVVDFRLFALRRMVIYAPWNGIFYRVKRWHSDLSPASSFASKSFPECASYADYMRLRYGISLRDEHKPGMIETKRVEHFINIPKWVARIDRAKNKGRRQGDFRSISIPEIARVIPLPYAILRMAMLFPRVVAELEGQLLAVQCFRDQYCSLQRVWPPTTIMIEAMTGLSACTGYNYERLEILGDSILKLFTTLDVFMLERFSGEGRLSSQRQGRISNFNLIVQGNDLCIPLYARLTPYNAKLFAPPAIVTLLDPEQLIFRWPFVRRLFDDGAYRWKSVQELDVRADRRFALFHRFPDGRLTDTQQKAHDPTQLRHRREAVRRLPVVTRFGNPVPPKSLADILEATIASFYLGPGGLEGAIEYLIRVGLCTEQVRNYQKIEDVVSVAGALLSSQTSSADGSVPQRLMSAQPDSSFIYPAPFIPDEDRFPYAELEEILQYRFHNRRLLFLAVTHPSVDISHSYERLEWLGDAALDWVVTRYYWEGFKDHRWMTPGRITLARQTAVCNEAFARVAIQHGLHRFLRINAPNLQLEIAEFVQTWEGTNGEEGEDGCRHGELPPAPKVLGDLFESIAGGMFLDMHLDVAAFETQMLPLLTYFLTHHADPYDLPDQPLHEFWHTMRVAGYSGQVAFRFPATQEAEHTTLCQIVVKGRVVVEARGANRAFARINACRAAVAFVEAQQGWRDLGPTRR